MAKDKQKQLLTEVMNADAKDGLYESDMWVNVYKSYNQLTTSIPFNSKELALENYKLRMERTPNRMQYIGTFKLIKDGE